MADNKVTIQEHDGRELDMAVDAPVRVEGQFVRVGSLKPGTQFEVCWGAKWETCTLLATERVAVTYVVTGTPASIKNTIKALADGISRNYCRSYVSDPVISKL